MSKKYYFVLTILVLIVVAVSITLKRDRGEKLVPLNAKVMYSDKKFTITNIDTIDFIQATLSIDEYYKIGDYNLQAGETYTIWQNEFVHRNGKHYPTEKIPVKFAIWCETKDSKNGFYSKKVIK